MNYVSEISYLFKGTIVLISNCESGLANIDPILFKSVNRFKNIPKTSNNSNSKKIRKNIGFVEKNLSQPIPIKIPIIIGEIKSKLNLSPILILEFLFLFLDLYLVSNLSIFSFNFEIFFFHHTAS